MGIYVRYTLEVHPITDRKTSVEDVMEKAKEINNWISHILDDDGSSNESSCRDYTNILEQASSYFPGVYLALHGVSEEGSHEMTYFYQGKSQIAETKISFSPPNFDRFF